MESSWTLESIIAMTIISLAALPFLVFGVLAFTVIKRSAPLPGESLRYYTWGALSWVVVACLGVGLWLGMYPWRAEYHQWRPASGVVATVDKRLVSNANSMSMDEMFVVRFQGSQQQYGVLDTRAAGVRAGDRLSITCVKRWQWSGTHGLECNFVGLGTTR